MLAALAEARAAHAVETRRAQAEAQRAYIEERRAQAAEARIAALEAELAWQARLNSYAAVPAASVPAQTFTLDAPATARVYARYGLVKEQGRQVRVIPVDWRDE